MRLLLTVHRVAGVGVKVCVGVEDGVNVGVREGVTVFVGVDVGEGVTVGVAVKVGVGVKVGNGVKVGKGVLDGIGVGVCNGATSTVTATGGAGETVLSTIANPNPPKVIPTITKVANACIKHPLKRIPTSNKTTQSYDPYYTPNTITTPQVIADFS
jgi:hypothetical protein